MSTKLYVGNLPYSVTEEELENLFKETGEIVSVKIITDYDGRPKGFGFVEMASKEAAQEAIDKLNGYSLSNRKIVVNEARPKERKERDGRGYGGGRGF